MKLVSFYCDVDGGDFYKNSSIRLMKKCNDLGVPSLILEENFGESWIDNVRAKPIFLLKMMSELDEDIFWLDVDCQIHKNIDFELTSDWSLDFRTDGCPHDYVHFIKNTESNRNFIRKWIKEVEYCGRGSHTAFIGIHRDLYFSRLPVGYVSLGLSNVESKNKYFENE
jgi:hypothetical protein